MKDLYASLVNKRIQSGNLPHCQLQTVPTIDVFDSPISHKARLGLSMLQANPDFLLSMVRIFSARAQEINYLPQDNLFQRDFNLLINTDFSPASINLVGQVYQKATAMLPFVTFLDKVLWYAIHAYDFDMMCLPNQNGIEKESLFYAWISILKTVQKKEQYHGKTINLSKMSESTPLYELLCGDTWDNFDTSFFSVLTTRERAMFEKLHESRGCLQKELLSEISTSKLVANETQEAWEKFIEIVNSLSLQESATITKLMDTSLSKREKLSAIQEYNATLYGIGKGYYPIGHEDIPLIDLLDAVLRRFQVAPSYCCVQDSTGTTFRLWPLLPKLLMQPETYNYLYIVYHQFRVDPKKDNAKQFAELALSCLYRNLGINKSAFKSSISDIVTDFYSATRTFVAQHRDAIENLSFDTLQLDSVLSDSASLSILGTEEYEKIASDYISSIQSNSSAPLSEQLSLQNREQILAQLDNERQRFKRKQEEIEEAHIARQIVVSLNIIYMFCSALRIMLTNKRAHVDFSNKSAIMKVRDDLLDIDYMLIQKVYSSPGSMRRYRESTGIIADTLSDLEDQEEKHRTILFFGELQSIVNELTNAIETQCTSSILEIKRKIQKSILNLPICEFTEQGAEWLDSISDRISAALVGNCKSSSSHFEEVRQLLLAKLGPESKLLPPSTLASLVTAELLYEEYASTEYAGQGFDYSCISALYYQAFEEAYNLLIWHEYSKRLNTMPVDGKQYVQILDESGKTRISNPKALGYLDERFENRKHYVIYDRNAIPHYSVKPSCMYINFVKLMEQVKPQSRLDKFCDYVAEITGFPDAPSMFSDADFMKKLQEFTSAVEKSTDDRNNASHGGSAIDIVQCDADKKAVLNGLEAVRKESLGLIQQLLYLMRNMPQ